ncbi:hypothetical protein EIB71_07515 [Kaistella daneshvariae]|uniref:Uncharacterized protein n=1 Tax=Kaistella daneshvariae TaxID=2487074 RepID=A0ABN5SZ98_9FLAO|nr:hypothetical protein EIB71_07515 [Kaistella daneshvariae]
MKDDVCSITNYFLLPTSYFLLPTFYFLLQTPYSILPPIAILPEYHTPESVEFYVVPRGSFF